MQRTRAWRRSEACKHNNDQKVRTQTFKPPKKWKLMYTRSDKLARARQLGMSYPVRNNRQWLEYA
ncbi:hypothetical protein ASF84_14340 [Pseudomonas sp. Leaf127]|uniref:hypothetical protein n=1 Tax=Pseudomonas sp. Leaf127 TaxID=1736267 RepID=UPI0007039A7F|nr:hypothetical protein [Pseudomonas sp. Leaf127]KQQ54993.1 hypothetical protein ASF84_14340 [Pseudomonas sp. Leaf127]